MSEPLIRRRSLPDSLRYLARKLDEPLSDAERAGVALTLNSLADEAETERDAFAHELAEQIRKQTARGNLIRPEHADAWEAGLDRAADLIEPRDEYGEPKISEEKTG